MSFYNNSNKEDILIKQNIQINVDKSIEDFNGFLENENKIKSERNSIKKDSQNFNRDNFNTENDYNNKEIIKNDKFKEISDNNNKKLKLNSDPPYLPSKSIMRNPRAYTLVLDLDETLVHFVEENDSAFIQIRPGAETFLEEMSMYYEIVIFTAAMQDVKYIIIFINIFLLKKKFFYFIYFLVCRFGFG